ncbi:MAG: FtsH protease activity modulator HflK [Rickettsiaceae bacterium]|nr:FtsH protease activity modulator HflK [Rickettsiaceae bacterium]
MTQIFKNMIFIKSPWSNLDEDKDPQEENIFTRKRKNKFDFGDFQFDVNPKIILLVIAVIIALWLSSGIYKVEEGEQALVVRFGKINRIGRPGLNYYIPEPIEKIYVEKVDQSRRIEVGYRSNGRINNNGSVNDIRNESIMLTGDENIVSLHIDVTWHIDNLPAYIFNISDQEATAKAVAVSAIREVVGNTPISSILSNKKQMIAEQIEKLMQVMLSQYKSGIVIEQVKLLRAEPPEEVIAAYRDVQTAKADKEKIINQAEAYKNDILPRARGEAAKIIEEANAYNLSLISHAKGDSARFDEIYEQYKNNKIITKNRLYIETIESILQNSTKVIMGSDHVLPHMSVGKNNLLNK